MDLREELYWISHWEVVVLYFLKKGQKKIDPPIRLEIIRNCVGVV